MILKVLGALVLSIFSTSTLLKCMGELLSTISMKNTSLKTNLKLKKKGFCFGIEP